jgi:hypothetical protein
MGRHGYHDDCDDTLALGRWRAQVKSAIRGKRGQKFLRELVAALEALPEKRLVKGTLQSEEGGVCAIGSVGVKRSLDMKEFDPYDAEGLGETFDIAHQMVRAIEYENDEGAYKETPEERWERMLKWAMSRLEVAP